MGIAENSAKVPTSRSSSSVWAVIYHTQRSHPF